MEINIEQVLLDVLSFAESEKEKQKILNFFADKNNQARASAEETGNAFKVLAERLSSENNKKRKV